MTDNEIIKALECCVQNTREACVECPIGFEGRDLCLNVAMEEAIDLINRQKAEIEELQHKIARLKTENLILSQNRFNIFQRLEYAEKIESKARKEFAERLKEIASEIIIGGKYKYRVVTIESIYNTLAELSNQTEKGGEPDA